MTKKEPHSIISVEDIFKSNVKIENNVLTLDPSVSFSIVREWINWVLKDVVVIYSEGDSLKCDVCGGKLNKNGFHKRKLNKSYLIHLQKYKCSNKSCDFSKITNIENIVPKSCNYENELRYEPIIQNEISYMSLEKISESIDFKFKVKPCRQSILNFLDDEGEEYLNNECEEVLSYNIEDLSGVFAIDEQFPSVNGEFRARPVIFDVHTNIILDEVILPLDELTVDFKEEFMYKNFIDKNVKGIVSDGDKSYATIIDQMNFPHQLCVFHIMQNLMTELIKPINKFSRKIKSRTKKIKEIENKIPLFKSNNVKKKNKKKIQKLKKEKRQYEKKLKELEDYKERISNIFKQKDIKKAKMRFNTLYNNSKNLPTVVATFIGKLKKTFDKAINYMKYDFFPTTNNQLECYNGVSLPDNQKRKYRTDRGLERAIILGRLRWTKRNRKTIQS